MAGQRWGEALLVCALLAVVASCTSLPRDASSPEPAPVPEPVDREGDGVPDATPLVVARASRLFAAADQYGPDEFSAYGIVAFAAQSTPATVDRYRAICSGFVASIPSSAAVSREVRLAEQMVTVWPLEEADLADSLNVDQSAGNRCTDAVANIDLARSLTAIRRAEFHRDRELAGDGPFVLAWSPASEFSRVDAHDEPLVLDLSRVANEEQATRAFRFWVQEIQDDPEQWSGWSFEWLRLRGEQLAVALTPAVLSLFARPSE